MLTLMHKTVFDHKSLESGVGRKQTQQAIHQIFLSGQLLFPLFTIVMVSENNQNWY